MGESVGSSGRAPNQQVLVRRSSWELNVNWNPQNPDGKGRVQAIHLECLLLSLDLSKGVMVGGDYGSGRKPQNPPPSHHSFCRSSRMQSRSRTQTLERKWPQDRLWSLWRHPLVKCPKKGWTTEEHREPKLMLRTEGFNDPPPVIRLQRTAWPGTLPDASHATIEIASDRL